MNCISNRLDGVDYHFPFMPDIPIWENVDFQEIEGYFNNIIEDMKCCPQGQTYHAEGDVWTHTKMVIQETMSLEIWDDLSTTEKSIMFMTALFHDMAKPLVTDRESTMKPAPKHAVIGARWIRELMWRSDLECTFYAPWQVREYVADMIMLHSLPVHFLDKRDPDYTVYASSNVVSNLLLGNFCLADMKGRTYMYKADRAKSLDAVTMFQEYCVELECHNTTKVFPSDTCRMRYFFDRKGDPRFDYFEETKGTVVMVSGVQGSGKSYTLKNEYSHLPVVGIDESREILGLKYGKNEGKVLQHAKNHCKELMRDRINFAFNATNCIKDVRRKWICLFRAYGYAVDCHYVEKPMEVTLANNKNRDKVIPESSILHKFSKLDFPTGLEFRDVVYNIENE